MCLKREIRTDTRTGGRDSGQGEEDGGLLGAYRVSTQGDGDTLDLDPGAGRTPRGCTTHTDWTLSCGGFSVAIISPQFEETTGKDPAGYWVTVQVLGKLNPQKPHSPSQAPWQSCGHEGRRKLLILCGRNRSYF